MNISVIWVPDPQSQEKMRAIRRKFAQHTLADSGSYPHITLGSYYDISFDALNDHAGAFALRIRRFQARFVRYKLLNPSCLAIEAENTGEIKSYYEQFHEKLDEYADDWTRKASGLYLPHSTVLCMPGEDVRSMLTDERLIPFDVTIEKLQLSRIYDGPRYEILSSFDLADS